MRVYELVSADGLNFRSLFAPSVVPWGTRWDILAAWAAALVVGVLGTRPTWEAMLLEAKRNSELAAAWSDSEWDIIKNWYHQNVRQGMSSRQAFELAVGSWRAILDDLKLKGVEAGTIRQWVLAGLFILAVGVGVLIMENREYVSRVRKYWLPPRRVVVDGNVVFPAEFVGIGAKGTQFWVVQNKSEQRIGRVLNEFRGAHSMHHWENEWVPSWEFDDEGRDGLWYHIYRWESMAVNFVGFLRPAGRGLYALWDGYRYDGAEQYEPGWSLPGSEWFEESVEKIVVLG